MSDKIERRPGENALRDMTTVPVQLLYDEGNDLTVMQRGTATGSGNVEIVGGTVDEVTQSNNYVYNSALSSWEMMKADGVTSAITTISYPHHEVHQGRFYRSGFAFTLANGNTGSYAFTTPAAGGRELHCSIELHMTAGGTFTVYEDVTSYSGGAAITPLNHNRNSANTSDATDVMRGYTGASPISRTGGTTILNTVFSVARDVNPTRNSGEEFIWKSGSKYVIEYLNSTASNFVQLILEWYEHTPEA
jgi:hypothetical protein